MSVGVSDKALQEAIPDADPTARATAINALLNAGKIDLFRYEVSLLLFIFLPQNNFLVLFLTCHVMSIYLHVKHSHDRFTLVFNPIHTYFGILETPTAKFKSVWN